MPKQPTRQYEKISTISDRFNVTPKTLKGLILSGKVEGVCFGQRSWRIYTPSLEKFLSAGGDRKAA